MLIYNTNKGKNNTEYDPRVKTIIVHQSVWEIFLSFSFTDSPSTACNTSLSPMLSTSNDSQSSLQRLDLIRSLSSSHGLLDELISIFDTISFSSDEIELLLSKIAIKHNLNKHDLQRLIATTKKRQNTRTNPR